MVCQEIKRAVLPYLSRIDDIVGVQQSAEDSLLTGNLGLSIYHLCLSDFFESDAKTSLSIQLLEDVLQRVQLYSSTIKTYQYSNGFAGLGTTLQFFVDRDMIDYKDLKNEFSGLDDFIYSNAATQIQQGYTEFLHGGAGALYYFGMRKPDKNILLYTESLINGILTQVQKDPLQMRMPRSIYLWTANDDYDLSLSHGLCGILLVLLFVLENGQMGEKMSFRLRSYLHSVSDFVYQLHREIHPSKDIFSYFPSYLSKNLTAKEIAEFDVWENSRLAWCYGDLGWVLYFYRFGKYSSDYRYIELAHKIGYASICRKTPPETNSSTSHICHGHAGLALFYDTLYQLSKQDAYNAATEFWIRQILESLDKEITDGYYRQHSLETSFLEGLPGVGMTLATLISDEDISWKRILLL